MAGIEEFLETRAREGLLRKLKPISFRKNGRIYFNKKEYLDFSSNDYLGLSDHPQLIDAAKEALDSFGASSSASRLLSGDLEMHHRLEEDIARFKNKEGALVFNSGYQANIGILSALYDRGDAVFSDRLNHASIVDGMVLSRAKIFRFQHNDPEHLESLLKRERQKFKKALIITETIFSMDGDRARLKELAGLKDKYDCEIMADEAHATGIYGKSGSGLVEEENLTDRVELIMGTFSKALGGFGAYLATSKRIVEYLVNTCRSFIYSTALPPATIASNLAAIQLVKEEAYRRCELLKLSEYFRDELKNRSFEVRGASQIVPVIVGESVKALAFSEALQEKGYWVLPIRPPTVPKGEARLRFSVTLHHDMKTLSKLIDDISYADSIQSHMEPL
ncbi:MAG: 8-amino-7-oxononanoate synthase [Candidatus Omnitrophica bacterium]|nr:8-amino-7-oxononanoate synthase [Candidatus Omnitrophota bacterium]